MSNFELAQLNIAHLKAPIDSPTLADFVANLDRINLLADASVGFRWRLKTDEGNATSLHPFGDDVIVNMSVWRDLEALRHFVYNTAHIEIMKRRREWFAHAPRHTPYCGGYRLVTDRRLRKRPTDLRSCVSMGHRQRPLHSPESFAPPTSTFLAKPDTSTGFGRSPPTVVV